VGKRINDDEALLRKKDEHIFQLQANHHVDAMYLWKVYMMTCRHVHFATDLAADKGGVEGANKA
jgi:hypothetical protein